MATDLRSSTLETIASVKNPAVIQPSYNIDEEEGSNVKELIESLNMIKIPGGVYLKETDRPQPIQGKSPCTTIYYLMTSTTPIGKIHYNKTGRSIHIVQKGRAVYVLIYPNGDIKTFTVGLNHSKGEVSQFVVPANVWKGCYVISGDDFKTESNEDFLFASEVVVPGFDFEDMVMMDMDRLVALIGEEKADLFKFML